MTEISEVSGDNINQGKTSHEEWIKKPISDGTHFSKYLAQEKFNLDRENIKNDTIKILSLCRNPNNLTLKDPFNSAGLIIGNIQSGKTGSMEAVSCLARDNGYKVIIIISGIVGNLTSQTFDRFYSTFNEEGWLIKKTINGNINDFGNATIENTKNDIIQTLTTWHDPIWEKRPDMKKTVVIVIPKHPLHMNAVAETFRRIHLELSHIQIPTLIIDDESDQYTINVANRRVPYETTQIIIPTDLKAVAKALNKNIEYLCNLNDLEPDDLIDEGQIIITDLPQSSNYRAIKEMKCQFPYNSSLRYTATPQADLLSAEMDEIRPNFHGKIHSGKEYTGWKFFFENENNYNLIRETIPQHEIEDLIGELNDPPPSLITAINNFILTVAIGCFTQENRLNKNNRSMLISMGSRAHTITSSGRDNRAHENVRMHVESQIDYTQSIFRTIGSNYEDTEVKNYLKIFQDLYALLLEQNSQFDIQQDLPPWGSEFIIAIRQALESISIVTMDSNTGEEVNWHENKYARILIGGNKLSRGFTVEGLTVTYLSNYTPTSASDTLEQRARFYGYRKKYSSISKIYLTDGFANHYQEDGEMKESLEKSLEPYSWQIGGTDNWQFGFLMVDRHRITRPLAIRKEHIIMNVKNRTTLDRPHKISQNHNSQNLEVIEKYFFKSEKLSSLAPNNDWIENERCLLDNIKLSDVNSILKQFNYSETDAIKFKNLSRVIDHYINTRGDDPESAIIFMSNLDGAIGRRQKTERDTINPNRGIAQPPRPNDRNWHIERIRGETENDHPIGTPTLRIFIFDVYSRDIDGGERLIEKAPILSMHLPTNDLIRFRVLAPPGADEIND